MGHAPRIEDVLCQGENMVADTVGDCSDIEERVHVLRELWASLQEETRNRQKRLQESSEAQQYYLDAGEAEAWISEQELYMIADENLKVRPPGKLAQLVPLGKQIQWEGGGVEWKTFRQCPCSVASMSCP